MLMLFTQRTPCKPTTTSYRICDKSLERILQSITEFKSLLVSSLIWSYLNHKKKIIMICCLNNSKNVHTNNASYMFFLDIVFTAMPDPKTSYFLK